MSRRRALVMIVLLAAAGLGTYPVILLLRRGMLSRRLVSHREIIRRWSSVYGLPSELVEAVVSVESAGKADAVSPKNARGLMQLTENAESDVVQRFRISRKEGDGRFFDPEYNIMIGTAYLRLMIDRFDGDVYAALAAYNMGPTKLRALLKANSDKPPRQVVEESAPKETRLYCRRIFDLTDGRYAALPARKGG